MDLISFDEVTVHFTRRSFMSNILKFPRAVPIAIFVPSGEYATHEADQIACPSWAVSNVFRRTPVCVFQICALASSPTETKEFPSGEKSTDEAVQ